MSRSSVPYAERIGRPMAVEGAVEVLEPVSGFYRMKMRSDGVLVGIRIWFGPPRDPVTGEELDRSWRWQAEANGEMVEDFNRVWPQCAGSEITEAEYREYIARQQWAREHAPATPFADPRRRYDPLNAILPL